MLNSFSLRCAGSIALVTLAALSLGTGGCTSNIAIDGPGGAGGGAQTTASTSTGTGGTPNDTVVGSSTGGMTTGGVGGGGGGQPGGDIAMINAIITQVTAAQKQNWLDVGESLDPTTLIVLIGDHPETCNAPVFDFGTQNHHQVLIGLPEALQKVGKYDMATTDLIAHGSTWLTDGMGNGGGGEFPITSGTVEVLSIDVGSISLRITGLSSDFGGQNGDHVATICPSGV